MASATYPHGHGHGLDTMITVKLQYEGITRRTKMPLRDMMPAALETNVRAFLHIPVDARFMMERYSDSAARYVHLDPKNASIYKQLYRAAKAKSKLKIRASIEPVPEAVIEEPVAAPAMEAEPEVASEVPATETPEEMVPEMAPEMVPETTQEAEQSPVEISPALTPVEPPTVSEQEAATSFDLPYRGCPAPEGAANPCQAKRLNLNPEVVQLAKKLAARMAPTALSTAEMSSVDFRNAVQARLAYARDPSNVFCPTQEPAVPYGFTSAATTAFAVCCNKCEKTIPDIHYHCSTCDDGDFDLCQSCIDQGSSCNGSDHWLIKRTIIDGCLVNSTTKTLEIKPKGMSQCAAKVVQTKDEPVTEIKAESSREPLLPKATFDPPRTPWASLGIMRTCNCCVQELPEKAFLHCNTCEDYDLCQPCFSKNAHGHHPSHGFRPAVKGTELPRSLQAKMAPGRSQKHLAICDGCDKNIVGVRHKCVDCPDWDFCDECLPTKDVSHPHHRFVPIYEPMATFPKAVPVHVGICCDGPLCAANDAYPAYIRGTRYKCAICNDRDYCAHCQACPLNTHNITHPMIMFRTPVRSATIVTTDAERKGHTARVLGDTAAVRTHKANEAVARINAMNRVQTNVDIKPVAPAPVKVKTPEVQTPVPEVKAEPEVIIEKEAPAPAEKPKPEVILSANFLRETVRDGSVMPGNHVFEQTWVLRNNGKTEWPAGCSVKFVGGDYMGHVDSNHPAGISELISASESTICYNAVAPGQEFPFTVLLRTPSRAGNLVSYWRLTSPSGHKFGDRLWCDVHVRTVSSPPAKPEQEKVETPVEEAKDEESQASSQMIFPKLEKESPVASIHESAASESVPEAEQVEIKTESEEDWDISEDGFMTDEEYDILDASDEEYLEEQKKKLAAK